MAETAQANDVQAVWRGWESDRCRSLVEEDCSVTKTLEIGPEFRVIRRPYTRSGVSV